MSLWTIDMAHVCSIMKIKHAMYTINMGVQENYADELFYSKDKNFDEEKHRIEEKFANRIDLGAKTNPLTFLNKNLFDDFFNF